MSAEFLMESEMFAFADKMDVKVAQQRRKAVRILDCLLASSPPEDEPIGERFATIADLAGEETLGVDSIQPGDRSALRIHDPDLLGIGTEDAQAQRAAGAMRSKRCERVAVAGFNNRSDNVVVRSPGLCRFSLRWRLRHRQAPIPADEPAR